MPGRQKIENWILDWGLYDEPERRRVEQFVAEHPEWYEVLESARQWSALLADARKLTDPEADEDHAAYAIATHRISGDKDHPLRNALSNLFQRMERDPQRRAKREMYASRKETAEEAGHAGRHFERLSGHSVAGMSRDSAIDRSARFRAEMRRSGHQAGRRSVVRRIAQLSGGVVALYVLLFFVSLVSQDPLTRLVELTSEDRAWTDLGVTARGSDVAWEQLMQRRYEEALTMAASSRRSFLGLFPSYRLDRVRAARDLLEQAMARQLTREPVPAEAYLTLAKLHYLLGDTLSSLDALRMAIDPHSESNGALAPHLENGR